jgi:hypothetical protein
MRRLVLAVSLVAGCSSPKSDCPPSVSSSTQIVSSGAIPSASGSPSTDPSLVARGRRGELAALKELELVPVADRSVEQSAAIAAGHVVLGKEAAATLGRELTAKPELLDDRNVLAQLFSYASDPVIAEAALPVIANIDRPIGPDMLYEVAKHDTHAPSRSLADDLLRSRVVKKRASKQLEFLVSLENEERCEKLKTLLDEDGKHADRRALPRLEALEKKDGCGEKKADDCFACLRDEDSIARVRTLVEKQKKQPKAWEIRRR